MLLWTFEDYRQDNAWVGFDDQNQIILEDAWQAIQKSRSSSPSSSGTTTPKSSMVEDNMELANMDAEAVEAAIIKIEDSHFTDIVEVSLLTGFAFCASGDLAGDLTIDRCDKEKGEGGHEWLVKELCKWHNEADQAEERREGDGESDVDGDDEDECRTKQVSLSKSLSIPICSVRERSRRDEGYGSYDSGRDSSIGSPPMLVEGSPEP